VYSSTSSRHMFTSEIDINNAYPAMLGLALIATKTHPEKA